MVRLSAMPKNDLAQTMSVSGGGSVVEIIDRYGCLQPIGTKPKIGAVRLGTIPGLQLV